MKKTNNYFTAKEKLVCRNQFPIASNQDKANAELGYIEILDETEIGGHEYIYI